MPDTKDTFDSISQKYDLINDIISLKTHTIWKKNFIKLFEPKGKLLDVATGTGDIAIMIKENYPNTQVFALDPSKKMLEIAKNRKKGSSINFIEGCCEEIPFPDSTFDFVTITFGLRNTKSVATSLDEIKRVLKNDGKLVLMEFSKSDNLIIKVFYKFYLNIFIPFIGLLFGKFAEYKYLASSIESFYTPKEMNEILNSKRLNVIQNIKYNFGLVSVYISNNSKS